MQRYTVYNILKMNTAPLLVFISTCVSISLFIERTSHCFLLCHFIIVGVAENLKGMEECVKRHLNSEVKLEGDYIWQVKDTLDSEILKECEECYLPDHMKMQVLGDVRHSSWDSSLVLMVCEDGQIYAYDDQQLHLVAESLRQLFNERITFPCKTVYHYGQAFEDMVKDRKSVV